MPRLIPAVAVIVALFATACSSPPPDIVGKWRLPVPGLNLTVDFKKDGTYSGVMIARRGAADVSGTYKIEGNTFTMSPPTLKNADGTSTTPEGQNMHLTIVSSTPDEIKLTDGHDDVFMTRQK